MRLRGQSTVSPWVYLGLPNTINIAVKSPIKLSDINVVMSVVSNYFKVDINDMKSKVRKREIVVPRQLCMYIMATYSSLTLKRIGLIFHRDHSTVIYAKELMKDLSDTDKKYKTYINECLSLISEKLPYMYFEENGN